MNSYKVYCLRDQTNEIVYVGCTRRSLKKRFIEHVKEKNLIMDDYKIELITETDTAEQMFRLEAMLIEHYQLQYKGLNKHPGNASRNHNFYVTTRKPPKRKTDRHWTPTEAQKQRLRTLRGGYINNAEHQRKLTNALKKKVLCVELNQLFSSIKDAANSLGLKSSKISSVCRGRRHTTGGFHFKFVE